MDASNVVEEVKAEIDLAFSESISLGHSYASLVPRLRQRLLPVKDFLEPSLVGFISHLALTDPRYEEVCSDGQLYIQKRIHLLQAPWTSEQVDSLNEYQQSGKFHSFTHDQVDLIATPEGWVTQLNGTVVQTWCHPWMADFSWKK